MKSILLVALGGAFGSVARFKMSTWMLDHAANWRFPIGTFIVNVVGCLLIGILAGLAVKDGFFSSEVRVFLFTGILGGFTTFSAFELETFQLLRRGEFLVAGSNVVLSIVLGLVALWIGFSIVASRN